MENNELNLITEEEIEQPKFYYEPTFEATKEVPVYDEDGNQTGTETRVTGRILKKVWTDEEEIARREIANLKAKLVATDYQAIKYAEGAITAEEYAEMKIQRQAWRDTINELEKVLEL